ncbi:type II toxin-antitoxin system RelE/ParE family toxin [Paraburkholderia sp. UYCP14C]|uniref:type II toxin-antitoxin system RelE family toxin n=1 Tax=Paraburkholderia sp. UYCP14C TaxID=2511130 RepID=UPI0010206837|nr:type II toxin-antitoxin system RelE/ParE family toxin [Paraburkholderia sp. UYCP14C]RZF25041.1 type II toxin-antitoxin system RelE/ParE family toxin [Paraburkholderia sp. UYCP14C]
MTYSLAFLPSALKEWEKLDATVRERFKKKLKERLENPRVPSAALSTMPDTYKIKLASLGFRLVYRVDNGAVVVTVITMGKRNRGKVYAIAHRRLDEAER